MRLLHFLIPIFSVFSTNAYLNPNIKPHHITFLYNKNEPDLPSSLTNLSPLPNLANLSSKINGLLQITRAKSVIPPTLLLCFSSGWLMNPSLIQPLAFYVSTIDTILVMSASMVINDIYDIEMDKINSPTRPLIRETITKKEAYVITFILLLISEYLNLLFLPSNLQPIVHFSIAHILLYTSVFKKIIIIKNIYCALLIWFSVFFIGLSSSHNGFIFNKNSNLLIILANLIFTGSWSNEILLDIRDYEGDKKQHIQTISTVFGKKVGWYSALLVLSMGTTINSFELSYLFYNKIAIVFFLLHIPQIYYLFKIKKDFSNQSILYYMNYTNKTLFVLLLYIICLSKLK